jgi:hypothetical protein
MKQYNGAYNAINSYKVCNNKTKAQLLDDRN